MAQMKADRPHTLVAAGAMPNPYRFVKYSADYTVTLCGAGDKADGVNLDTPLAAGDGVLMAGAGSGQSIKVEIGAAVSMPNYLKPDAAGRAIPATTGQVYSARPMQAGTASGQIIEAVYETGVVP